MALPEAASDRLAALRRHFADVSTSEHAGVQREPTKARSGQVACSDSAGPWPHMHAALQSPLSICGVPFGPHAVSAQLPTMR